MRRSLLLATLLVACGGNPDPTDDAGAPSDAGARVDAGPAADAGAEADAGGPADGGAGDAGPAPTDAGVVPGSLVRRAGCFFTIGGPDDVMRIDFGEIGTRYGAIVIEVDVDVSNWRRDLFSRPVLSHNAVNLFRNAPVNRERYIGGFGVLIRTDGALRPETMFFARVDLEPRPPGMGYTAYTAFRDRAPWTTMERYHLSMRFDAVARRQTLEITRAGAAFSQAEGAIDYFDPTLTDDGWYLELGAADTAFRDVNPIGWQFCDLSVVGEPVP